jgi:hypothetical protein
MHDRGDRREDHASLGRGTTSTGHGASRVTRTVVTPKTLGVQLADPEHGNPLTGWSDQTT